MEYLSWMEFVGLFGRGSVSHDDSVEFDGVMHVPSRLTRDGVEFEPADPAGYEDGACADEVEDYEDEASGGDDTEGDDGFDSEEDDLSVAP
jgi:hypothetical protein